MDSYVIRIYRRSTEDPREIVGLVEIISSQEQKAFKTFDELREILQPANAKRPKERKNRGSQQG